MKKLSNVWLYAIIFTLVVGFSSCSKDKDDEVVSDPTTVLTTGTWKVADGGVKALSGDLASQTLASLAVGFEFGIYEYKFQSGGVLNLSGFGSETGTWELGADKKTLTLKDSDQEAKRSIEITEAKTGSMKWKVVYKKADLSSTSDVTFEIKLVPKS